jgi:hypothetical protein
MSLPSSGPLSIIEIYDYAVQVGYTGGKDLRALALWSGWDSSNPNIQTPHQLREFYDAYVLTQVDYSFDIKIKNSTGVSVNNPTFRGHGDPVAYTDSYNPNPFQQTKGSSLANGATWSFLWTPYWKINAVPTDDIGMYFTLATSTTDVNGGTYKYTQFPLSLQTGNLYVTAGGDVKLYLTQTGSQQFGYPASADFAQHGWSRTSTNNSTIEFTLT